MSNLALASFDKHRANQFIGPAIRLGDLDLPRIGHLIGVGEDEVHAILDVEAAGRGYNDKKQPKILFEPHVFYRNLPAGSLRDRAVREGLAYRDWKTGHYGSESEQHLKLARAMAIHETAAIKAASWGLGQILGENHVAAGYETPQAMVVAFVDKGESEHLAAMIRFIKFNHLDDELRAHNWAGFARGYNGAGYAKHGYHTKLAAAFAKWRKIRDTQWTPDMDTVDEPALVAAKPIAPVVIYGPVSVPTAVVVMPDNEKKHDEKSLWDQLKAIFV